MNEPDYLILLTGMALVTYLPRMLPLVVLAHRRLPREVVEWLDFIPIAILSALVAPGLFADNAARSFELGRLELLVAIPTLLVAVRFRSLGGTVIIGMGLYWLGTLLQL